MKTINLSKILGEEFSPLSYFDREKAMMCMRNACMQTIDLCAEEAEADSEPRSEDIEVYVLKESILKVS